MTSKLSAPFSQNISATDVNSQKAAKPKQVSYRGRNLCFPIGINKLSVLASKCKKLIEKLFSSNGHQKQAPTVLSENEIYQKVKRELEQEITKNFNNEDYMRQAKESLYCSIFSDTKDEYCINCVEINKKECIKEFQMDIGIVAQRLGLPGKTEKGIFVPNGQGSSPFGNMISAALYREMKAHGHKIDSAAQREFQRNAKNIVWDVLALHIGKEFPLSPMEFRSALAALANKNR